MICYVVFNPIWDFSGDFKLLTVAPLRIVTMYMSLWFLNLTKLLIVREETVSLSLFFVPYILSLSKFSDYSRFQESFDQCE